jgi:DNA-binding response OmpR family regulator
MNATTLQGQHILVVEDNALIAMSLEDILREAGAEVVGPVATLDEAERTAAEATLTGAVLDIMLEAEEVWPVAKILQARGVPFIFSSGHFEQDTLPVHWAKHKIVTKPARAQDIVNSLAKAIELAR